MKSHNFDVSHPINWGFFKIPSDRLYYFLGYVAGDGVISSNGTAFSVSSCKDPEIIYKFRNLIAPNHKISVRVSGFEKVDGSVKESEHSFNIGRKDFWSIINAFDVKSPSVFTSGKIPVNFLPSFIRGFMDSDGSVSVREQKISLGVEVKFGQNDKLYLEALKSLLESWNLRCSSVFLSNPDEMGYAFKLGTVASLALLERLYANKGDFYLQRKFVVYQSVIESRKNLSVGRSDASRRAAVSRSVIKVNSVVYA